MEEFTTTSSGGGGGDLQSSQQQLGSSLGGGSTLLVGGGGGRGGSGVGGDLGPETPGGGGVAVPTHVGGAALVSRQSSCVVTPGLRYRNLGKSGLRVSNVGLGTWVTFGSGVSEEAAEEVVRLAYESGINVFDVSEAPHSGPRAEVQLGRILHRRGWKRASFVVTTKIYWNAKSEERGLSRKHVIESVRASLARLQLGYIDVVIVHRADPMCPMEEVVRAMNHVISQGWAMYWGTARWTPVEVMEAYTNCRQFNCVTPICEQAEYHMFCRDKTELYMPELYNKIGVGLMAWSPLTMGLVSGKLEDGMSLFARASFKNKYSTFSWTEDETQAPNKENYAWMKDQRQTSEDMASPPGGGSVVVTSGRRGTTAGVIPLTRPATAMGAPSTPGMAPPSSRHEERLREVSQIAERLGCSVSQLATAWCLKNEAVHCLLLGAASPHQLYENLQSLQLVPKLTSSTMSELERILENKPVRPPIVSTLALR